MREDEVISRKIKQVLYLKFDLINMYMYNNLILKKCDIFIR